MISVKDLSTNPKIASAVSGATASTGVGQALNFIPDDIGKLATLVGIVLSSVLIYTHIRRGRAERKKAQLDIELLEIEKEKALTELEQIKAEQ